MRLNHVVPSTLALAACAVILAVGPAMGSGENTRIDAASPIAAGTLGAAPAPAGGGVNTGGCKSVTTFISSAVPELQKDGCSGCHAGTSATATGALDLSSLGKDYGAACAQALNKVDLTNKLESALIQAPAGTQTHMGGKVADTQGFTAAVLGWVNNE
jgi:hypothetical protein